MSWAPTFHQLLLILSFSAATFVVLRWTFNFVTQHDLMFAGPPILSICGVIAAYVFLRLNLHGFFFWYLVFLAFILFGWRRKSDVDAEKIIAMSRQSKPGLDREDSDIVTHYMLMRKFLTVGFLAYATTFSLSYAYLMSRN